MRRLTLPIPLVLACALAWVVAMVLPLTSGAFWPIAVAPELLHHHATTFVSDPISVLPLRGDSWVVQPWLVALGFDGAWRLGGITMLSILQGILAVAAAALAYRIARLDASPAAAGWAAVGFVVLTQPTTLRAEQVAVVLALALMLVLRSRRWWLAPLVVAVWVNVHGSFVIGLELVVAAVLGMVRGREPTPVLRTSILPRVALVVMSAAASLVSPLGVDIVDYVRSVDSIDHVDALTPIWSGLDPIGVRAIAVYAALALIGASRWRDRASWRDLLPLIPILVLLIATFDAVRYASWLAVALLPELAIASARVARSNRVRVSAWSRRMSAGIVGAALLVALLLLVPGTSRQDKLARVGVPTRGLLASVGRDDIVFASPEWADYIRIETGARVALDVRLERYRSVDLGRYLAFRDDLDGELVRRVDPDQVLVHHLTLGDRWPELSATRVPLDGGPTLRRRAHDDHGAAYDVD